MAKALYLVRWHPDRVANNHPTVPRHTVFLCTSKAMAIYLAGWTGDRSWVWSNTHSGARDGGGWLLERWEGLVIDYGYLVLGGPLPVAPEDVHMGFWHPGSLPWQLLKGAVWYDSAPPPDWLTEKGVVWMPDSFTRQSIEEHEAFLRQEREMRRWERDQRG